MQALLEEFAMRGVDMQAVAEAAPSCACCTPTTAFNAPGR
jgi:hypothetical protein